MKLKIYGLDYDNAQAATTRVAQAEYAEVYGAWLEETSAGLPVLQIMPRLGPDGLTYVKDGTLWELGLKIGAGLAYDGSGNLYATQSGLDVHTAARACTTANVTLTGGAPNTLDGVTLATNDRILVRNQSTGSQNGIYYVSSLGTGSNGTWTRATDADTTGEIIEGTFVFVTEGSTQANTGWTVTTTGTITIGSTAIVFEQFSGGENLSGGAGLVKTGTTLDVVGTTNRILVNTDSIDISPNYVGQASITTLGTISTGVWQGTLVSGTYGGTGVNNGSNTITLAGNLVTAGAFALTLTTSATTNATLPAGSTTLVPTTGTGATGTWGISVSGSAATLTTARTLWGQSFNGSAAITGSLTDVVDITGGANSMVITAGTGNSRTLTLRTTTSGGIATTALTLSATQTATFAQAVTVSAGGVAVTGNSTITGTLTALTGITSSGTASFATVNASALITANLGLTVASAQTLTLTGATVAGTPTWSSNQAITLSTAAQPNVTSLGTLTALSIGGNLTFTGASRNIIAGTTNFSLRNNANNADNMLVTDAGAVTFRSTVSGITTLTATTLAGTLSTAAQTNVTSLGTLTALSIGGNLTFTGASRNIIAGTTNFSLRNNANNADNLLMADDGVATLRNDLLVGSLGRFDAAAAPSTGMFMAYDLNNDAKWRGVAIQLSYASNDTKVDLGTDSTAYSYILDATRQGDTTTPAAPGAVTLTGGHLSNTLDWSTTTSLGAATFRYRVQYSTTNAFAGEEITVYTTSRKFVHSRLTSGTSYYYRVAAQGASSGTPGAFSANTLSTPTSLVASRSSDATAFGSIIAGEIAVANLAAINANLGKITGTAIIQNDASDAATRSGIRFSGGSALPTGWTNNLNSAYYLDLTTNSDRFVNIGSALRVFSDGSATFSGAMSASALLAGAIRYNLSAALTGATVTAVVVTGSIAVGTPATGLITLQRATGLPTTHAYTSWSGSTFTIASTDFSANNAPINGVVERIATPVDNQAIVNTDLAAKQLLVQPTGTFATATGREPTVRGFAIKDGSPVGTPTLEVYDRTYDGTATSGGASTLTDSAAKWALNQWAGPRDGQPCEVQIVSGTGASSTWYTIASNTATQLTLQGAWAVQPDATSVYKIRGIVNAVWGNYTATVGGTLVSYFDSSNTQSNGTDDAAGTWDDVVSTAQRGSFTAGTTTGTPRYNKLQAASSLPANGDSYTIRYTHRLDSTGLTTLTGKMNVYGRTKVEYSTGTDGPPPTGWVTLVTQDSHHNIPNGETGYDSGTEDYTETFTIPGVTTTLWIRVIASTEYAGTFTASGTHPTTYSTGVHVSYAKTTAGTTVTRRSMRLWPTANKHNDTTAAFAPNFTLEPLAATPSSGMIRGDFVMVDGGTPSTTLPYFYDGQNWQSMKSATPGTHGREAHTVNLIPTNGSLTAEGDITYNTTSDRFEYHDGTTTRSLLRREGDTMTGLLTANAGVTVASGQTMTLTGATVAGTPTWSSSQAITLSTAAQPNVTSLGTLTILNVDNLRLDGNTLSATTGAVNITPVAGSAIVLDGTINVDAGVVTGATSITSTTFVGALTGNATSATTAVTVTQAAQTAITSVGTLTALATSGPVTITSASASALAVGLTGATNPAFVVNASTALQVAGLSVTGAVTGGTVAVATLDSGANTNLTINAKGTGTIGIGSVSTGRVTITPVTTITGSLTLSAALIYGGVTLNNAVTGTGNMVLSASPTLTGTIVLTGTTITGTPTWSSSQAITLSTAAQPNVTSVGTLTILNVDNLQIDGNTLSATTGAVNITPLAGSAIVLDGTINVDAGVVTGATSITSTSFVGALTGNASTATSAATLTTARNIWGQSFNGSAAIGGRLEMRANSGEADTLQGYTQGIGWSGSVALLNNLAYVSGDVGAAASYTYIGTATSTGSTTRAGSILQIQANINTLLWRVAPQSTGAGAVPASLTTVFSVTAAGLGTFAAGLVATSGGLNVGGGGITITGNSTIAGTLTSLTGITSSGTASFATVNASALITANLGLTVASAQTLTVTGATITGLTAASVGAGTFPAASYTFSNGVTATTFTGALSGNATTATTLQTSRNLWGVAFNGGSDVTAAPTFNAGLTVGSGQTLTLTGATVAGTPTWSSSQAITLSTAAQPNVTSLGTLSSLSVTGGITVNGLLTLTTSPSNTVNGVINALWGYLRPAGRKLYVDEQFTDGVNSVAVYNNSGGTAVTHTRKNSAFADSHSGPPNTSGYVIEIRHAPLESLGTTPNYGGWRFGVDLVTPARRLLCVFKMKIPSGRSVVFGSNSMGTNGTSTWLTSTAGTGLYQDYAIMVHSGTTPSSTHFFSISGGDTSVFYTYLASAQVYDVTDLGTDAVRALTVSSAINPLANDTVTLGSSGNGFQSLRIQHNANRAVGIALVQTLTATPSPRLFFNNTTDSPAGGNAVFQSGTDTLSFTTGATPDSSSGTTRWTYNASSLAPAITNSMGLGTSSFRWSNLYSVLGNFSGDLTVGSLGAFNSAAAPANGDFMVYNLANNSRWQGARMQLAFASNDTTVTVGGDGTAYSYIYQSGRANTGSAPAAPLALTATLGHLSVTLDWSSSPFTSSVSYYELQYDDNAGFSTPVTLTMTSRKFVHSRLTLSQVLYYRVRAYGGATPAASGWTAINPAFVTVEANSSTSAFGSIIAAEIAVTDLSAINANLGKITGTGLIQNNSVDASARTGIRFSTGYSLPSGWTSNQNSAYYLDLTPGADRFINIGQALRVFSDGSATFSGAVTASALRAGETRYELSAALTGATVTAVVVTGSIAVGTASTGTITIQRATGLPTTHAYTAWSGSTFTIASTDFSTNNAPIAGRVTLVELPVDNQAIVNAPLAVKQLLIQPTGTFGSATGREPTVRGFAIKDGSPVGTPTLEVYDRTYDGTATSGGASTLTDSAAKWALNQWAGPRDGQPCEVQIVSGTGASAVWYPIAANTATQLTLQTPWAVQPDATSVYKIRGIVNAVWGNYTATVGGTLVSYFDDSNTTSGGVDGAAGTWDDVLSTAQRGSFTAGTTTGTPRYNKLQAASSLPANGDSYTIRFKHRLDSTGLTSLTGKMNVYGRTKVEYSTSTDGPPPTGWTTLLTITSHHNIPPGEVGYDGETDDFTETFTIPGVTTTLWIRVVSETEYAGTFTASGTHPTTYSTGVHVSYAKTTSGATVTRRSLRLWPTANKHNDTTNTFAPNFTLEPLAATPSSGMIRGDFVMVDGGSPSLTAPYFYDGQNWQSMKSATPGTHGREAHTVNLVPTNGGLLVEGDFTYNTTSDRFEYHDGTTTRSLLRREGDTMSGNLTVSSGGITVTGNSTIAGTLSGVSTLTATTFSGSGASLTNLPAASLTGTIDMARLLTAGGGSFSVMASYARQSESVDLNTLTQSGTYGMPSAVTNGPSGNTYDTLLVQRNSSDVYTQLHIPRTTGRFMSYRAYNSSAWTTWQTVVDAETAQTISGAKTFSAALTYGGVALSNSVTGTGSMVLSASPALTGTPTAPTAASSTSSTQIATTAYVKSLFYSPSTSGTLNWNDVTNTRPGVGPTLLLGNATNGPSGTGVYYHPLNVEYSTSDGTGNLTQLAIAYGTPGNELWMRGRYTGGWSSWIQFLSTATPAATFTTSLTTPLVTNAALMTVGPSSAHSLVLRTNGTSRITIDSAGNVAIGGGGLSGLSSLSMSGALSGVTTISTSGTITIAKNGITYIANDNVNGTDAATLAYHSFQRGGVEKGYTGFATGSSGLFNIHNGIGVVRVNGTSGSELYYNGFARVVAGNIIAMKTTVDFETNVADNIGLQDYNEVHTAPTFNSGGTTTCNISNGNVFTFTMTGNTTVALTNPPGSTRACTVTLVITQDATGNRAVTWPGGTNWGTAGAPALGGANKIAIVTLTTLNNGSTWYGTYALGF